MEDEDLAKRRHAAPRPAMVAAATMQKALCNNKNRRKPDLDKPKIATRHTRIRIPRQSWIQHQSTAIRRRNPKAKKTNPKTTVCEKTLISSFTPAKISEKSTSALQSNPKSLSWLSHSRVPARQIPLEWILKLKTCDVFTDHRVRDRSEGDPRGTATFMSWFFLWVPTNLFWQEAAAESYSQLVQNSCRRQRPAVVT